MDSSFLEFLLLWEIISNTWFMVKIREKRCVSSAYSFVVVLTVADFLHHIHGALYKLVSHQLFGDDNYYFQSFWTTWLSWNQVIGFAISILPLFSVCHLLIEEGLASNESVDIHNKTRFQANLHTKLVLWFIVSMTISLPITLLGSGFRSIGWDPNQSSLSLFEMQRLGRGIQVRDELPMTSFGIKSKIGLTDLGPFNVWVLVFRVLSNPLWFPLALPCCLPILAFVLLKRNFSSHQRCDTHPKIEFIMLKTDAKIQSQNRLLIALLGIYYFVFLIDLANFGGFLKLEEGYMQSIKYTNSILLPGNILEVTYVFHHWSRPLGSILRNGFLWMNWKC